MSEQQGGRPPGWPASPGDSFGPGRTVVGEPLFDPTGGAFPSAAQPAPPSSGEAKRPAPTLIDQALEPGGLTDFGAPPYSDVLGSAAVAPLAAGPFVPPTNIPEAATYQPAPSAPVHAPHPMSGAAAMQLSPAPMIAPAPAALPMGGPSPYGPNPYGPSPDASSYAMAPPMMKPAAKAGGLPLIAIGAIAFVLIGGVVTTAFWLSSRASSAEDDASEIPTIAVPAPVVLPGEAPATDPSAGEPGLDPPATAAPGLVPVPAAPPAAKPAAPPPPAAPATAKPPAATPPPPANTATGRPPSGPAAPTATATATNKPGSGRVKIPTRN